MNKRKIVMVLCACIFMIWGIRLFLILNRPSDITPVSVSADNVEETYISKVREAAKGEIIVKSICEDFAMDGSKEAFILTKKRGGGMEAKFSLWFVSDTELKAITKNVWATKNSTLKLIKNKASKHVLFSRRQFTLNKYFVNSIYGVYSGKPKVLFKRDTIALDVKDNRIYGTEKQYCYYDAKMKILMVSADVTYEFFWNEQEERYMEYGADFITKGEFLQYSGAQKVWTKIRKEVSGKNRKIKYTFLKRTNNTIDINIESSFKNGDYYKSYVTLMTENGRILTTKIDLHDGNKKRCKYPEIAY